jgi:lia operon protein LiaG
VKTDAIALDTGSGDVRVSGLTATQLKVDTGSGEVIVSAASVRVVNVDTGSGDIRLGLTSDLDGLSVDTGSGDVELTAPASLGAQVDIETTSGDIDTQFPLQVTRQGHDGLKGTIGDGKGRITIETASGDVALRKQP